MGELIYVNGFPVEIENNNPDIEHLPKIEEVTDDYIFVVDIFCGDLRFLDPSKCYVGPMSKSGQEIQKEGEKYTKTGVGIYYKKDNMGISSEEYYRKMKNLFVDLIKMT